LWKHLFIELLERRFSKHLALLIALPRVRSSLFSTQVIKLSLVVVIYKGLVANGEQGSSAFAAGTNSHLEQLLVSLCLLFFDLTITVNTASLLWLDGQLLFLSKKFETGRANFESLW